MTYVQTDQVPITFHCLWGGTSIDNFLTPPPPKTPGKLIAWFGTNCHGTYLENVFSPFMQFDIYFVILVQDINNELIG